MSSAAERMRGERDSDEALGQFLIFLRTRGHRAQALLNAVERAPRAGFVAPEHIGFAYRDMSLPLPCGQETGRPLAVMEAVAALRLKPQHHVLEVGSGSGWQTALIASLAGAVAGVERWRSLAEAADARLQALGFENAVIAHGDGAGGLPDAGPFDRIVFTAAIRRLPDAVLAQLSDGGIIVAPILKGGRRTLTRFVSAGGSLEIEELGPSDAPLLLAGTGADL